MDVLRRFSAPAGPLGEEWLREQGAQTPGGRRWSRRFGSVRVAATGESDDEAWPMGNDA
jgi:hypothetical protein